MASRYTSCLRWLSKRRRDVRRCAGRPTEHRQDRVDRLLGPLPKPPDHGLDREIGRRLDQIIPIAHSLYVFSVEALPDRLPGPPLLCGTLRSDLWPLCEKLIAAHDPLAARTHREALPFHASVQQHAAWLRQQVRYADCLQSLVDRCGASHLIFVPARLRLTRGTLYAFQSQPLRENDATSLSHALQTLAAKLERRRCPFIEPLPALELFK